MRAIGIKPAGKAHGIVVGQHGLATAFEKRRGGGGQYPSALVNGEYLYVLYSMGKEDVWISKVPLADIGCER